MPPRSNSFFAAHDARVAEMRALRNRRERQARFLFCLLIIGNLLFVAAAAYAAFWLGDNPEKVGAFFGRIIAGFSGAGGVV